MNFLRIFLLNFEHVVEHRVRIFIWFLVSLYNPLLYILYWRGAFQGRQNISSWTLNSMTSYFFLLTIVASALMAHIEEDVSQYDIQEGQLVQYLLKPFPYFLQKFFEEIHYRLLQGLYGLLLLMALIIIFGFTVSIVTNPIMFFLALIIAFLAYILSFCFKMTIGLLAFWMTDIRGLFLFIDMILFVFAGYIVPIDFLFNPLNKLAYIFPFAYMIYFPVIALQGKLTIIQLFNTVCIQIVWIGFFIATYKILWKKGVKIFSGVSQ
jgi:ABC-2 type transport system permease protein